MASPLVLCILLATLGRGAHTDDEPTLPHFKWGQTKQKLFVTVAVRDLDRDTVQFSFSADTLKFQAFDAGGKVYSLKLRLAQDVNPSECRWEQLSRKERWGEAVLATLTKTYPIAWAKLVEDPAVYRQVMDRDWSRDDEKVEVEEDTFFDEHSGYLPQLLDAQLSEELEAVEAVVVVAHHAACEECKVVDTTFAKAAKQIKEGIKTPNAWQKRVHLRALDVRSQRALARELGVSCAATVRECKYFVFSKHTGRAAFKLRGRHDEAVLIRMLEPLARPQFQALTASDIRDRTGPVANRSLLVLRPDVASDVRLQLNQMTLRLDISIARDQASWEALGMTDEGSAASLAVAWRAGEAIPRWSGATIDDHWLRMVAIPSLANLTEIVDEEPYEEVGLPIAKIFLDGETLDAQARRVVAELSSEYFGRMNFIARNAKLATSDWRQHGLPPGRFPAFAVASSTAFNSSKYAFLDVPKTGAQEFWLGPAKARLAGFLEDVIAGRLEQTLMSEDLPDESTPSSPGAIMKLVGRQCRKLVEESTGEALIEGFDEWRRDHARRTRWVDLLAPMLAAVNISVYRLDMGYNECPRDVLKTISPGYSGYFFVHPHAKQTGKKLQRLKKLDADMKKVVQFVQKNSKATIDVEQWLSKVEGTLADEDQREQLWKWTADWWRVATAVVITSVVAVAFLWYRFRSLGSSSDEGHTKQE